MAYFCHECNRPVTVQSIGNSVECTDCHGEFVEEMGEGQHVPEGGRGDIGMDHSPIHALPFNEFDRLFNSMQLEYRMLLGALLNQRNPQPQSTSAQRPRRRHANADLEDADPMRDFIGQLVANLVGNLGNQSGAIRIEFGDGQGGRVFHGNLGDYAWGEGGLDQVVTMLLNQFEGTARGISKEDLRSIPMMEVTDKQVENGTQCTTCMETFNKNESVAQLDCQHIFHRPCIEPWLERNNTCPICRKEIEPSKWPKKEKEVVDIDELD